MEHLPGYDEWKQGGAMPHYEEEWIIPGCPGKPGVEAIHSDSYYDGGRCSWCGAWGTADPPGYDSHNPEM